MVSEKLREKLAAEQHEIWAYWMKYMFSQGIRVGPPLMPKKPMPDDYAWMMTRDKYNRWRRQMNTSYTELTEKEKESDREMADRILAIIEQETERWK